MFIIDCVYCYKMAPHLKINVYDSFTRHCEDSGRPADIPLLCGNSHPLINMPRIFRLDWPRRWERIRKLTPYWSGDMAITSGAKPGKKLNSCNRIGGHYFTSQAIEWHNITSLIFVMFFSGASATNTCSTLPTVWSCMESTRQLHPMMLISITNWNTMQCCLRIKASNL